MKKIQIGAYIEPDVWNAVTNIWDRQGLNKTSGIGLALQPFCDPEITKYSEISGTPHHEIISRLVRWFGSLPPEEQFKVMTGEKKV